MSMKLSATRNDFKDEIAFDFLAGATDKIRRVDEVHASEEDDANYTFIIWLNNLEESEEVYEVIARNVRAINRKKEWHHEVYDTEFGTIIVASSCTC